MPETSDHVKNFIDFIAKEKNYSEYTVVAYKHDLLRFTEYLKNYQNKPQILLKGIDKQTIRHFLGKEFEEGFNSRTVARRLATIKSFFKFLQRNNQIHYNPAKDVRTPKTPKKLPSFINENSIQQLMNLPTENTILGLRDKAMMELFYSTGMRLSELYNLNLGDIQFNQMTIRVLGKGKKERIIPFGNVAKNAMEIYLNKRGLSLKTYAHNEPCFVNLQGIRISKRTIQRRVQFYLKQMAESSSLGPHAFRHSFATHMLERGADIRALKDLLGHSSLSSTQVYTHIQPEKLKKIYEQAHPHGK